MIFEEQYKLIELLVCGQSKLDADTQAAIENIDFTEHRDLLPSLINFLCTRIAEHYSNKSLLCHIFVMLIKNDSIRAAIRDDNQNYTDVFSSKYHGLTNTLNHLQMIEPTTPEITNGVYLILTTMVPARLKDYHQMEQYVSAFKWLDEQSRCGDGQITEANLDALENNLAPALESQSNLDKLGGRMGLKLNHC